MTSRKKLLVRLTLVPPVMAGLSVLAACICHLCVGLWPTMSQMLVLFAVLSLFYAGLAVYVYLKEEYIL